MATLPKQSISPEEYIAIEERLGEKYAYHDGQMYAMSGGSEVHSRLQMRLAVAVGSRLKEPACRGYSSDFRVVVEALGMATYPDLSVICEPTKPSARFKHSCTNPAILFEVLSPSTERYDRGARFEQYRKIESLREYVLVSQQEPAIDLFRLENGHWVLYEVRGLDDTLYLHAAGIEVPMVEIFRDIPFEKDEGDSGLTPLG